MANRSNINCLTYVYSPANLGLLKKIYSLTWYITFNYASYMVALWALCIHVYTMHCLFAPIVLSRQKRPAFTLFCILRNMGTQMHWVICMDWGTAVKVNFSKCWNYENTGCHCGLYLLHLLRRELSVCLSSLFWRRIKVSKWLSGWFFQMINTKLFWLGG